MFFLLLWSHDDVRNHNKLKPSDTEIQGWTCRNDWHVAFFLLQTYFHDLNLVNAEEYY
jgi:hypothetical protein